MEAEIISAVQNGSYDFIKGFLIGALLGFGLAYTLMWLFLRKNLKILKEQINALKTQNENSQKELERKDKYYQQELERKNKERDFLNHHFAQALAGKIRGDFGKD